MLGPVTEITGIWRTHSQILLSSLVALEIHTQNGVPKLLSLGVRTHTTSPSQFRALGIAQGRLKLIDPEAGPNLRPLSCFFIFKTPLLSPCINIRPAQT